MHLNPAELLDPEALLSVDVFHRVVNVSHGDARSVGRGDLSQGGSRCENGESENR